MVCADLRSEVHEGFNATNKKENELTVNDLKRFESGKLSVISTAPVESF